MNLNSAVELSWVGRDRRARRCLQGKYGVRRALPFTQQVRPSNHFKWLVLRVIAGSAHFQLRLIG